MGDVVERGRLKESLTTDLKEAVYFPMGQMASAYELVFTLIQTENGLNLVP